MNNSEVYQYVDHYREEAISFLQEMLQTPSPTGEELAVSQVVTKWLAQDGLQAEEHNLDPQRPNIISYWQGDPTGPRFMFNGHLDVFPPSEDSTRDPWSGEIIDGNIYGRGSADMKAGVAAGIMAVKLLKRSGFIPKGTIVISCTCDEEQGSTYGLKYLISQGLLDADFGVCMEASEDMVIVDSDGRISYQLTYYADPWHAGTRLEGDDALKKACKAMNQLYLYDDMLKMERYFNDRDGGAILSITAISAGDDAPNVHPASCTISIDRRYTTGETIESATAELKAILDDLKKSDPAMDYQLEMPIANPQLKMDTNSPCIYAALEAYKDVFGQEAKLGRRCSGGDTCKLTSAYGYPLPQFGPGRFDQLCTVDEHVSLDEYISFIKIYMQMVIKLLG